MNKSSKCAQALTDLEITRLCASAMGVWYCPDSDTDFVGTPAQATLKMYDPLHDDAQAMALGKKYPDEFKASVEEWAWQLSHGSPDFSLNYCFCGRIAKIEASK